MDMSQSVLDERWAEGVIAAAQADEFTFRRVTHWATASRLERLAFATIRAAVCGQMDGAAAMSWFENYAQRMGETRTDRERSTLRLADCTVESVCVNSSAPH